MNRLASVVCLLPVLYAGLAAQAAAYPGPVNEPFRNVQCERQVSDNRVRAGLAGAVVGGILGGAIGNNIDNDRYYTRYGRRGPVTIRESRSNSGQVAAGAAIGALAGALAGSGLADRTQMACQTVAGHGAYPHSPPYPGPRPAGASIPRTTDGLYGGEEIMQAGPALPPPTAWPDPGPPELYGAPPPARPDPTAAGGCRPVYRETRLPDGQLLREPAEACQDEATGLWQVRTLATAPAYPE